jgi:hypothetical protein
MKHNDEASASEFIRDETRAGLPQVAELARLILELDKDIKQLRKDTADAIKILGGRFPASGPSGK